MLRTLSARSVLRSIRRSIFGSLVCGAVVLPSLAQAQVLIAVVGDSNVNGKGVSPSDAYPAKLERALKARGLDVRVTNGGINGETSAGLLSRIDSAAPQGTQVAVVWAGINDAKRGIPREKIRANLTSVVGRLKAKGMEVVVIKPDVHGDLHNNPKYVLAGDPEKHLQPSGYDVVLARTLPQIEPLVARLAKRN